MCQGIPVCEVIGLALTCGNDEFQAWGVLTHHQGPEIAKGTNGLGVTAEGINGAAGSSREDDMLLAHL